MNTKSKLLLVSSLFMMVWGTPVWGEMSSAAPVKVTIEKHNAEMNQVLPQEDQNAFITSQVRVELRKVPGFKEDKVIIKTDKGVVSLTGIVADENIKALLEKNTKTVAGVDSVKNDLKIEKK